MSTFRQYAARTKKLEDFYIPKLTRIIKAYRAQFIADLKAYGTSTALNNLQKRPAPIELTRVLVSIYRTGGLMGAKNQTREINALLTPRDRAQIARGKKSLEQKAGFGKNESWIASVIEFLQTHLLKFVQAITETMREDIVRILQRGIDEGDSIDGIVKNLKAEGLIASRARVIARTEVNRSTNVGHAVGAQSLPYEVNKQWSAASDHRTRHSHRLVNAHTVDETDYFKVPIYKGDKPTGTFDQMLYPGDAEASAGNTINCRCRVIYLPKRDANGRLILRSTNQAVVIPMRSPQTFTPAQIAAQLKSLVTISVE